MLKALKDKLTELTDMTPMTTEELLDALTILVIELPLRSMNKEQILELERMAWRLTADAQRSV